jgi:two-component system chemotaxis response regulator CheB
MPALHINAMASHKQRTLLPGERIRVLVVDDSVVIRRLVTHALEQDPAIEVVGSASNGNIALQRIPQLNPDVLTLDIEMPEMDGLETLHEVRLRFPHLRVVMFSTLTERGAESTLAALSRGADDYVTKASNMGSLDLSLNALRDELLPKIRQFFRSAITVRESAPAAPPVQCVAKPITRLRSGTFRPGIVAIGISTGGPAALGAILPTLPAGFPLPVLIVQHMPPLFTRLLAERLNTSCRIPAVEATHNQSVENGKIFIAPGDFHMRVAAHRGEVRIQLDQGPFLNSCRPAVDALFTSVAEVYGGNVIAAVLTGMGQDGTHGAQLLRAQGAAVIAQDEATSVVWGMPGSVVTAGLADRVVPLGDVIPEILRLTGVHFAGGVHAYDHVRV